jgi:Na+-translocating ferredoxin:NAD+ oxidoreductase RnfC subunit
MLNVARNRPVTRKYLTVTGAVREPVTLCVPIGISVRECIEAAGGPVIADWVVLLNGIMMGKLADSPDVPVTKTTGGIYVFPPDHPLIRRYRNDFKTINRIGRSACDQCSFCTELCPRYLLGHPIEPHKAMRALGFTMEKASLIVGTTYCCECNICTMIACPEDLDPRNVCVQDKALVKEMGLKWEAGAREVKAHGMYDGRRTPTKRLITKLGLGGFENRGPLRPGVLEAGRVRIPLKMHAGAPCVPAVAVGAKVSEGDLIAAPPEGQLGAPIHASIRGTVTAVNGDIEISA